MRKRRVPAQKPGRSKQDYGTPPEFYLAVLDLLGIDGFACDLAASEDNAIARVYLTEKENSLAPDQSWIFGDGWNWLNPPFARIAPWVDKAYTEWTDHGVRTAVLVPAGVGANWWRDSVHDKARILLLNGRITFVGASDPYPKDCALLLYGFTPGYSVWIWR